MFQQKLFGNTLKSTFQKHCGINHLETFWRKRFRNISTKTFQKCFWKVLAEMFLEGFFLNCFSSDYDETFWRSFCWNVSETFASKRLWMVYAKEFLKGIFQNVYNITFLKCFNWNISQMYLSKRFYKGLGEMFS